MAFERRFCGHSGLLQHRQHELLDVRNDFLDLRAVGRLRPFLDRAVNRAARRCRNHLGRRDYFNRSFRHAGEQHTANRVGDRRVHERLKRALMDQMVLAAGDDVITRGANDALRGAAAAAFVTYLALVDELMKAGRDQGIKQRKLVGVMVVKRGPVYRGRLGDILHRNLVEILFAQQRAERTLQQLPSAPHPWIADLAVGNRHISSIRALRRSAMLTKRKPTVDVLKKNDICCLYIKRR